MIPSIRGWIQRQQVITCHRQIGQQLNYHPGYTCAEPYLFPDINKPDGPATAGIDDLGEILAKMKQRTSRGIRK